MTALFEHPLLPELAAALARHGVEHAELRWLEEDCWRLELPASAMPELAMHHAGGCCIRVLEEGAWGLATFAEGGPEAALAAATRAVEAARTTAAWQPRLVRLVEVRPEQGHFHNQEPCSPPADAADPAAELTNGRPAAQGTPDSPCALPDRSSLQLPGGIDAEVESRRLRIRLVTTGGTDIHQELIRSRLILRLAQPGTSGTLPLLPSPLTQPADPLGGWLGAGVPQLLATRSPAEEARMLLLLAADLAAAPPARPRPRGTVILDPTALGHLLAATLVRNLELDRILGEELSATGTSYLTPADLDRTSIAASCLSLRALPGHGLLLGGRQWDDEGVRCRPIELITAGRLTGLLASRETATLIEEVPPGGAMRASHWDAPPLIRAGSLLVSPSEAGPGLEELIASTREGVLIHGCQQVMVDPLGLTFLFRGAWGWEIVEGRRDRLVQGPVFRGASHTFWLRCNELGGPAASEDIGLRGLPKGLPVQAGEVGIRLPPARFSPVEVLGS